MATTSQRILVVEDDPFIALDIQSALTSVGYDVLGPVNSGTAAIQLFRESPPDLVLLDITIDGDLDGIQVAAELHRIRSVPTVFLSALHDEVTLQRARLVGPFGYLIKPFDEAELRATVQLALDRAAEIVPSSGESGTSFVPAKESELEPAHLSTIPVFELLTNQDHERLFASGKQQEIDGGTILCSEGEAAKVAFLVLAGRVSVKKTTAAGKELILTLLGPGDCFGLLPLLPQFNLNFSVQAQLDSKILSFRREEFGRLMSEIPQLSELLHAEVLARLAASFDLNVSLAHSKVETRILGALCNLASTMSRGGGSKSRDVRIFITRKELADLTGTTPETAIRVTKQLERDGLLDLSRPGVIKIPQTIALRDLIHD